jgi:hypothetical protein
MHANLVRRFAEAGLTLVLAKSPIVGGLGGRGASSIVQIDIQRKINGSRRHEWFRIFPGADDNRIEVVGLDKTFGQVVLMVHEGAREFEEPVPGAVVERARQKDPVNWVNVLAADYQVRVSNFRILYRGRHTSVNILRKTPSAKRHFLCGLDERQLFIAQLSKGVSTVRGAHLSLKSGPVTLAESQGVKAIRQGEFFFLEASSEENRRIEDGVSRNLLVIEHNVPIGPFTDNSVRTRGRRVRQFRGNPHTADELIVLPGIPLQNGFPVRGREVFIRGRVRHVDHAAVSFSCWQKVIRNAEANAGQAFGGWVD